MPRLELIEKAPSFALSANLRDYAEAVASFSWSAARADLGAESPAGLNAAFEAVTRHATGPRADHVALRVRGRAGRREVTFAELEAISSRFANVLRDRGVREGECVCTLLGRVPELHVAALGALKNRDVFCPLFASLGPDPLRARLAACGARVLVTTEELYRRNVEGLRRDLPGLREVLLVGGTRPVPPGTARLAPLLARAGRALETPPTRPEDPALLHFTSGTTAGQKGVVHVHEAVVAHNATARSVLDIHDEDVVWCPAAPGWIIATCYGLLGPLACGATLVLEEEDLDAERCYRVLQDERVTVWYTTPTTLRILRRAGADVSWAYDLSSLRIVASAGEPLDAELLHWAADVLGQPVHDDWWQTETGCIAIANFPALPIRPGSMGLPVPGIRAAVVRRGERLEILGDAEAQGELAIAAGWPSMFRAYLEDEPRYRACFSDGWYLTGDLVRRDADGHYWFLGRSDDVIKSAGQIVGPYEVERALFEHPAVSEVGVVGKPDPVAHEIVKAFIVLKPGFDPGDALGHEILAWARTRLGEGVAPREVEFLPSLPRTASGKLVRRLLKARELHLATPGAVDADDDA